MVLAEPAQLSLQIPRLAASGCQAGVWQRCVTRVHVKGCAHLLEEGCTGLAKRTKQAVILQLDQGLWELVAVLLLLRLGLAPACNMVNISPACNKVAYLVLLDGC